MRKFNSSGLSARSGVLVLEIALNAANKTVFNTKRKKKLFFNLLAISGILKR